MPRLVKRPSLEEILDFCAREPIERVFLEDVARRGLGRFAALRDGGELVAVCHLGANLVPSGEGARSLREDRRALEAAHADRGRARGHRPLGGGARPPPGRSRGPARTAGLRPRRGAAQPAARRFARPPFTTSTSSSARPRRRSSRRSASTPTPATRRSSSGVPGRRSRRAAAGSGRRAGQSSSRPRRPPGRPHCPAAAGLGRPLRAGQGLREARPRRPLPPSARATPSVCLFVRPENAPAIALYDSIGMRRVGAYRSLIFE